jgi:hypothetical protein
MGEAVGRLSQSDENSSELDRHKALFFNGDVQANSRFVMLREGVLEHPQLIFARSPANGHDLSMDRAAKGKLTFSDHHVSRLVPDLEPDQTVGC